MIRYGILGFGLHAERRLMPGFARARRSQMVALSRRSLFRAQETAARYAIPHAFDSKEELCRSPAVDAIFVATPNAEHRDDVLLALRCGKPVLCEKPMAINASQAEEMVRAARACGLPLGVALVFRFEASTRRLRQRLAAGEIGPLVLARAEFSYPGRNHARQWLTDRGLAGGGPICDVGIHCMDALRFILDDEVIAVSAIARADADSASVEAAAVISLEFARGALAAVLVSIRAAYRTPLELIGERGVLRADNAFSVEAPVILEKIAAGQVLDREEIENSSAYAHQIDAFSEALEGGLPFPVPGEVGLRDQILVDAAYRSWASGRHIAI